MRDAQLLGPPGSDTDHVGVDLLFKKTLRHIGARRTDKARATQAAGQGQRSRSSERLVVPRRLLYREFRGALARLSARRWPVVREG